LRLEEVDWIVRTLHAVQHITIEAKGGILPDTISSPGNPAPWICVAQGTYPRTMTIRFQLGSIDDVSTVPLKVYSI
jgi:hypothetical protein